MNDDDKIGSQSVKCGHVTQETDVNADIPVIREKERVMTFQVLVREEPVGGYSVRVPALPGCHSQGETMSEALTNIREAAELWLEVTEEATLAQLQAESVKAELQEIEL